LSTSARTISRPSTANHHHIFTELTAARRVIASSLWEVFTSHWPLSTHYCVSRAFAHLYRAASPSQFVSQSSPALSHSYQPRILIPPLTRRFTVWPYATVDVVLQGSYASEIDFQTPGSDASHLCNLLGQSEGLQSSIFKRKMATGPWSSL
jgi:hypothetical protein